MLPELLRNETCVPNVLTFALHAVTLLSQLGTKDFANTIDKKSMADSYQGFFQLFGGQNENLMFHGFQAYFQTLTAEKQIPMFGFMGSMLNTSLFYNALNSSCDGVSVDLRKLLKTSPKNYYRKEVDSRLTSFVDSAVSLMAVVFSRGFIATVLVLNLVELGNT